MSSVDTSFFDSSSMSPMDNLSFAAEIAAASSSACFETFSASSAAISSLVASVEAPEIALAMGMMVRVDTANTTAIKPERHLPHSVSFGSLYFFLCWSMRLHQPFLVLTCGDDTI